MRKKDEFEFEDNPSAAGSIVVVLVAILIVVLAAAGIYFMLFPKESPALVPEQVSKEEISDSTMSFLDKEDFGTQSGLTVGGEELTGEEIAQDPQSSLNQGDGEQGSEAVITEILEGTGTAASQGVSLGMDVSRYQGVIDWKQVAASGIDFAMIRVGYRTMKTGELVEDNNAAYNLQEATANGLKVGVYFFSSAVSKEEAIEEARWTRDFIAKYKITYPVVYNCEGYNQPENRQYMLTREERTELARAFLYEIYEAGYTPMFYASKGELEGDSQWVVSELEKQYKIWVSWYPANPYPETEKADYAGAHDMWQYTNKGMVPGVDYPVDLNVAYFAYDKEADAKDEQAPDHVEADIESMHNFREVNETVTAKEATNLRNMPSQGEESSVMLTLYNGQTATRTGVSDSGWSRVIYDGKTYYAVSGYLTTDLTPKAPEPTPEPDDGIKTVFTSRDEMVSPKIVVNLRTLPSVTNPESVVAATISNGTLVRRTGINEDVGWSRVEYEGRVLYCVSSYVYVIEETVE